MCGIAGKVIFGSNIIKQKDLISMASILAHRGPDYQGVYLSGDKKVGLVNRRLSIQDISSKGHMPMSYNDKLIITCNGEIYNFKEERKKLERMGYKFNGHSDTEVLLKLYDKYGTNCLHHLRGMFAFAIYDQKRNIIFLARDRIGKKPLKYYFINGVFIFASELKAILTQPEVKRKIDYDAINDYLTFGYVIPPQTGFLNINKLEPGSYLILDIKNNKLTKKCYWKPDFSEKLDLSENEWQKYIMAKLRDAVKLRMISDVPIGAFLSGGVDSSTTVALMAQSNSKPVKTFTIGFKDKELDESKYAENIAKLYNTDHQLLYVDPENIEILPDLAKAYEEPYADASCVVTYMVSKLAKKHVTVILNGDGGDENFVGYERFRRVQRDYYLDKYLSFSKSFLSESSSLLAKTLKTNDKVKRLNIFLNKSLLSFSERYGTYIQYFGNDEKKKLRIKELDNNDTFESIKNVFDELGNIDPRDKALYWDLTRYLPNDLLTKVDIASMAVGLEARSPFLDQEFIELACKIPFNLKYKNGEYKYILKKAIKELVPDENINRRKVGFTIPLDRWFEGSLNSYSKSILLKKNAFVTQLFDAKKIKSMLSLHRRENDFGPKLWALLDLELWYKSYFT